MKLPPVLDPVIRVWQHRNYAWYMGGMTPYLISTWMLRVGTGWLAWELTGSTAWLGLVAAADLAPMLVLSVFAGAIVDRTDPMVQQRINQWLQVGHAAVLAGVTFAGYMTIELLFALSLFLGCIHPFSAAARHSIVPATVPKESIATGLAVDSALFNASRFIGPAIAAPIIIWFGAGGVFLAHMLGCTFFLFALYQIHMTFGERKRHGGANMLADIREGFGYVKDHAGIAPLFLLMVFSATLIRPLADMLPGFAGGVFMTGPGGLAWLTASMGVGATISAASVAIYGRLSGLTLVVLVSYILHIAATLVFVSTPWLWLAVLAGVLWGYTLTSMSTSVQAMVQTNIDNRLRGRVMAIYTLIYRGTPAIGAVLIGALAEFAGLQLATAVAAVVCIFPWLLALRRRVVMTTALEGSVADWQTQLIERTKEQTRGHAATMLRVVDRARHRVSPMRFGAALRNGLIELPRLGRQAASGPLAAQLKRFTRRGGVAVRKVVRITSEQIGSHAATGRLRTFASGRLRAALAAVERARNGKKHH